MMIFTLILALAFAVVAVIFALANPGIVMINFFGMQMEGSLAMFVLISIGIGIVLGVLLMTPSVVKQKLALSGEKKKLKGTEKELDQHKSKMTELEEKIKKDEAEKAQVAADVQQRLDETLR